MKHLFFIFLLSFTFYPQTLVQDSTNTKSYKSKVKTGLTVGFGIQRSLFLQANLSLFKFQLYGSRRGDAHIAQGIYLGLDYFPKLKASAYAVTARKAGIEGSNTPIGYYALEFKYVSNLKVINDFIIMPKLGMGIVGLYSIYYGYNISTNKNPFPFIGNNQFGLNITLFAPNYRKLGNGVFRYR